MAMLVAARRLSAVSDSLRYSYSWRFFSTSFREERDTFGPILVPSDKFVLSFSLIFHLFAHLFCCFSIFLMFNIVPERIQGCDLVFKS